MSKNPTKKQLEKSIKEADKMIGKIEQWLIEWVDYRASLTDNVTALDEGTTPTPPPPKNPPITHFP